MKDKCYICWKEIEVGFMAGLIGNNYCEKCEEKRKTEMIKMKKVTIINLITLFNICVSVFLLSLNKWLYGSLLLIITIGCRLYMSSNALKPLLGEK
jgi:hypothetical protein